MVYTQAPVLTGREIEALLKEAEIARFCTLNRDGTIHAAPVWYQYAKGRIIVQTPVASRKARNLRHNRNVTILVDLTDPSGEVSKGVLLYGRADVRPWTPDMLAEAISFCKKYMRPEAAERYARGLFKLTDWVMISVKPKRIASFDYAKDDAYREATRG